MFVLWCVAHGEGGRCESSPVFPSRILFFAGGGMLSSRAACLEPRSGFLPARQWHQPGNQLAGWLSLVELNLFIEFSLMLGLLSLPCVQWL